MGSLLEVRDISVRFGGLVALDRVSLEVEAGEIRALIGPNGAGKTTLFNAVTGFVAAAAGSVVLDQRAITGLAPDEVARLGVRRTFQGGGLFPGMTVLENVMAGLHGETGSGFWGLALGLPGSRAAERAARDRALAALAKMRLADLADKLAGDLSFGQQRMVEVARSLVVDTRLLLLDEPASGLSPVERDELVAAVKGIAAERKIAILLIEHVIDLVMALAHRVSVLNYGVKIAEGTPEEVRANPEVIEAYLGRREVAC